MREINLSGDDLAKSLLEISKTEQVCLLDSCGVSFLGSHLLIAGIKPVEVLEITNENAGTILRIFEENLSRNFAAIFSISYDFGLKLQNIKPRKKEISTFAEPDVFLALFDCLVIHDYKTGKTFLDGNESEFDELQKDLLDGARTFLPHISRETDARVAVKSNFTRSEYLEIIEKIKDFIRCGDTYQTNFTQQLRATLSEDLSPQEIFWNLRRDHPAPFASFLKRGEDFVISASPERFFKVQDGRILTSPIKGTRPRGKNAEEDRELKNELLNSSKDRAENTMIVDLLRNDIGRICKFGSVNVEKLCDLEKHPTFFHLVSTVAGELREQTSFSEIIRAVFPCGSITGAPKIRTMQIIDELETANRGLSMGAIGYSIPNSKFHIPNSIDLSVAIRTMVVKNSEAIFNVGGGIVIDSIPESEYDESLTKAEALLNAINGEI